MLLKKLLNILMVGTILVAASTAVRAQEVQKIVAIVNEDIISGFDVIQRISLRIFMGGLPDTRATREQLVASTINTLIDDRLKAQETARFNISASDGEVNSAIERFEQRYGIRPGMAEPALASKKIALDSLIDQIRVAIAWDKLIRRRVVPRVNVTEEEVKAEQQHLRENKGKNEYLISEIFMAVDIPTEEAKISDQITRLYEQLGKGADFGRVATQFSQGPTASKGGEMGWFMAEDLEPSIGQVVAGKKKGAVLPPVRGQDGYYIVSINDVRQILSDKPGDSQIDLSQIVIPVKLAEQTGRTDSQAQLAQSVSQFVDNCEYLPQMFQEISNPQTGKMGRVQLSKLPDNIKNIVGNLQPGQASAPFLDKDVYRIFIVCDRVDANTQSDSEDAIRQKLGAQRIEARVVRYLNDLRREAVIESR
ncbi:hypothetical protein GUA87_09170 [Sneathiella sp. P13V-1]|uniref:peptidylprolyl isomerase n=1 Tax=Sneathiella sp. P13V-1 TaxID=2697366 RepID=UPI00187B1371|nr:hypothetical protein [Sneathiella sp. P13V-1]